MKKVYLIDCPGVVPPGKGESDVEKVLRGVVRTEHLENPEDYVLEILNRCKTKYVARTYKLSEWKDHIDFLEQLSKMVMNDWTRGKLPYFTPPPGCMMEPKPDGTEDDEVDDVVDEEEEEEDVEDEEDDEDDLANSDTDTVATTDTTETTETVDSLFEDARFPKEEEEVVKEKSV